MCAVACVVRGTQPTSEKEKCVERSARPQRDVALDATRVALKAKVNS